MGNQRHSYSELGRAIEANGGAPCDNIPEVFFPEDFPDKQTREYATKVAKAICSQCPLKLECFAYAIESQQTYGIWAGTLPSER
jgi:WhiB family redox-sensing transcriptional regulator